VEIVLEQEEVEALLREALFARAVEVPEKASFRIRSNHKKGTIRILFVDEIKRKSYVP